MTSLSLGVANFLKIRSGAARDLHEPAERGPREVRQGRPRLDGAARDEGEEGEKALWARNME